MHRLTIVDLELRVLDKPEQAAAAKKLLDLVNERSPYIRKVKLKTENGIFPGDVYLHKVEQADGHLSDLSWQVTRNMMHQIDERMKKIVKADPTFFEHPYLTSIIIMDCLQPIEEFVQMNRDSPYWKVLVAELKQEVALAYSRVGEYQRNAISNLEAIMPRVSIPDVPS